MKLGALGAQITWKDNTPEKVVTKAIAVPSAGEKPRMARCMGEHLVCSPCGGLAGDARWHRLAGSGGVAVALAVS